jgi:hypothetical protein
MSKMEKINTEWKTTAMARNRRRGEPAMAIGVWARSQIVGDEAQDRDDASMGGARLRERVGSEVGSDGNGSI